ncbi:MAG: epoxyqueuosine reductase QueH [Actinobacteria bacterium]|nr:epoxyqueuosine reductase QueH [Actinomycetota bacterium]
MEKINKNPNMQSSQKVLQTIGGECLQAKPKFLLHVCCANCLLYPFTALSKDFQVYFYFYNPNIHPASEYIKRLKYVKLVSETYKAPLIADRYEKKMWLDRTRTLKSEPEGGLRCEMCFKIRLEKTAKTAKKLGFDLFGTTLTISPHKNQVTINSAGMNISKAENIVFYIADFKKKDGFKKTMQLSKEHKIYRQSYCGCLYSMPDSRD